MSDTLEITFPGGLAVDATTHGRVVHTDQPLAAGGEGTGPSPFDLFLASIGTCAGLYAVRFCRQRNLSTDGMALRLVTENDPQGGRIAHLRLELDLPPGFPERYRAAIVRAVDQCKVKRHLAEPPTFETLAVPASEPVAALA